VSVTNEVNFNEVYAKVAFPDAIKILDLNMQEGEYKGDPQYRGKCPACGGGERALTVTPGKGFICFASSNDPKKRAFGSTVIALAAHVKGIGFKEAGKLLMDAEVPAAATAAAKAEHPQPQTDQKTDGKVLQHLQFKHERSQAFMSEEGCISYQAGYTNRGAMRDTFAIPLFDLYGQRMDYMGIKEDGTYLFYRGEVPPLHIFNAHQATGTEVQLLPTVADVLRAYDEGNPDTVCFLHRTVTPEAMRHLADWLAETNKVVVF